jgi:hypothetical protein
MRPNVAGIATLGDSSIWVFRSISIDLAGAVVFLIRFAIGAIQISANLRANTSPVANFEVFDFRADLDNFADNLVPYAEREWNIFAPATSDCMYVRGTDTAGVNGDVDIILLKWF